MDASADRRTGELATTKSERTRRVPIDRELLPLLRAMHKEAGGNGRVVATDTADKKLAVKLRRCLELAGVDRAELFVKRDATRKALTFHDLRATGITWCAVRGDEPLKIMQRAGHADFATTQGYIREAENLRDGDFGQPFPPLPPDLLASPPIQLVRNWPIGPVQKLKALQNRAFRVEAPGIEPCWGTNRKQAMVLVFSPNISKSRPFSPSD